MSNVSQANQYTEDERQQECWDFYVSELARGISNAKAAALKVGYSEEHADNITLQGWFKGRLEKLKRRGMLSKAEAKLEKSLEYEVETIEGEKTIINVPLLTVQTNVAKHLTLTLGKDEGYSTKQDLDLTSKGEKIKGLTEEQQTALNRLLLNDKQESSSVPNESSVHTG